MGSKIILMILAGWFLCLTSCADQNPPNKPIKIGLLMDLGAHGGAEAVQAAKLYFKIHLNNNQLIIDGELFPVEFILEDTKIQPKEAMLAARRLIYQQKVVAIIGPNISITALPAAEVAQLAKVPMLSPGSTISAISQNKDFIFQLAFNDDIQGKFLADFLYQQLATDSAVVIYEVTKPASKVVAESFIKRFKTIGGTIELKETFVFEPKECFAALKQSIDSTTTAIILPLPTPYSKQILNQISHAGFKGYIIGSDAWHPPEIGNNSLFDGAYYSHHWHASLANNSQQNKNFVAAYFAEYQQLPNSMAALTYDAVSLIIQALKSGNTAPREIKLYLDSVNNYQGLTGRIDFDKTKRLPIMLHVEEHLTKVMQ